MQKKKSASLPTAMTKALGKEGFGPLPRALTIALIKEFLERILKISLPRARNEALGKGFF
jgi:hypothetical protein